MKKSTSSLLKTMIGSSEKKCSGDAVFDASDLWARVKSRLRTELGEEVYKSWFSSLEFERYNSGTVNLTVPTRFLKSWVSSHYGNHILGFLQEEISGVKYIAISVRGAVKNQFVNKSVDKSSNLAPTHNAEGNEQAQKELSLPAPKGSPLDARLTFENFIVAPSNSIAYAAAFQVANVNDKKAVRFNPLYIHAPVGFGKTHLLHSIARRASDGDALKKNVYLTAERFMLGFASAIRNHSAIDFQCGMRAVDLFIIDDIQFLRGRATQGEFCHALNNLLDGGQQVVVASDRRPQELCMLDERVRSRLSGGLVTGIQGFDYDLRVKIIEQRAKIAIERNPNIRINDDVVEYIAVNVQTNGRDLEGAITRIVATASITGQPVTIDSVQAVLSDLINSRQNVAIKVEDIQSLVSRHYRVAKQDLLSSRRARTIVRPRQIAMYLAKQLTSRSLPDIGRQFGGRDHTTVLHAVRKIESLCDESDLLRKEVKSLKRELESGCNNIY